LFKTQRSELNGGLTCIFLDNGLHFLDSIWLICALGIASERLGSDPLDLNTLLEAPGKEAGAFFITLELGTGSTRFALPVTSAAHENDRLTL
jgi:hypothetical protein